MNAEVIKAMNKKEKKHRVRKWWNKNGYKVMRVILFPIWACIWTKEKITDYLNSRQEWSEERANKILSYYVPRNSEWDAEEKSLYFFDNGCGWGMKYHQKTLKRRDRRWWRLYNGFCGGKIRRYLIDSFELEGFAKEIGECSDDWTEITFYLIEK